MGCSLVIFQSNIRRGLILKVFLKNRFSYSMFFSKDVLQKEESTSKNQNRVYKV